MSHLPINLPGRSGCLFSSISTEPQISSSTPIEQLAGGTLYTISSNHVPMTDHPYRNGRTAINSLCGKSSCRTPRFFCKGTNNSNALIVLAANIDRSCSVLSPCGCGPPLETQQSRYVTLKKLPPPSHSNKYSDEINAFDLHRAHRASRRKLPSTQLTRLTPLPTVRMKKASQVEEGA